MCIFFQTDSKLCLREHCSHPSNTVGHIILLLSPFHRAFICEVDRVAIRKRQCSCRNTYHFALIRGEPNRRSRVCWEPSSAGAGRLQGSISSAQLTFFIKPHCIIMARVSSILHCCLISQLMLLLGAANPSFVLLKEPLSFHYHWEIEFVIYCKRRVCSSCVHWLLNLNKLQFLLLQCVDGVIFIPAPLSVSQVQ